MSVGVICRLISRQRTSGRLPVAPAGPRRSLRLRWPPPLPTARGRGGRAPRRAGPARWRGGWRSSTRTRVCELDFDEPVPAAGGHDPVRPDHRRAGQHGDAGAVRPLPGRRGPGRRRPRRAGGDHPLDRLLPQQDPQPHRHGPGPRRALRRRGADRRWRTWSRCPASAARRRTWCAAWPSTCPACRSTPTSGGCRRRLGLTTENDPVKVELELNAMIPAAERGGSACA